MTNKIYLDNLTSYYGSQKILDKISLPIRENRITTIVGPSGCGKTTLLMTLSGLATKYDNFSMEGSITYKGEIYTQKNLGDLVGKFGFVFQQPLTFPLSIEKNMMFATKFAGKSRDESRSIALEKLKEVNLWDEVRDKLKMKATKLSGGQQQRLCIARALTTYPDVLLMDEPCSALDAGNTAVIEKMLLELKHSYTIIFVTHNLSQAKRISDDLVFINDGRLIEAGESQAMFQDPRVTETKHYLNGFFG